MTEQIVQAQEMLKCIEIKATKVGPHLNVKKTEVMHFNQEDNKCDKISRQFQISWNVDEKH